MDLSGAVAETHFAIVCIIGGIEQACVGCEPMNVANSRSLLLWTFNAS